MRLVLKRYGDGRLRPRWFGVYQLDGKARVVTLCRWKGTPPESGSVSRTGDSQFEASRQRALQELQDALEGTRSEADAAALAERVHHVRYGHSIRRIKLADLEEEWRRFPRKRKPSKFYAETCLKVLKRFVRFMAEHDPKAKELGSVTPKLARAFMEDEDKRGVGAKTWNVTLSLLRQAYPSALIARRCHWDREADELVTALVKCRWVDQNEEHRLVLHDWHEHADNTVRTALLRKGDCFWNGIAPRRAKDVHSSDDAETLSQHDHDTVASYPAKPEPGPAMPFDSHAPAGGRGSEFVPTEFDVKQFADSIGLSQSEADAFRDYYAARGWRTNGGQPIRSWQAALRRWKATSLERPASCPRTSKGGPKVSVADYKNRHDPLLGRGEVTK